MKLHGSQVKALRLALVDAYPTVEDFRLMVREELNRALDAIAVGGSLNAIAAKVIEEAEAKGWLSSLVDGARKGNPGSVPLAEVAQGILASQVFEAAPGNLERIVGTRSPFVPLQDLLDFLERTKRRVCRVETKGRQPIGTAFLVGTDVILTNHHVVSRSIGTTAPDLQVRFDYLTGQPGALPTTGCVYELANTWLLGSAPSSPSDFTGSSDIPAPGELDFALLRLNQPAGNGRVDGVVRGWVEIPRSSENVQPDDIVAVIQHADGDPMRIAIDTVLSVNANGTRLTYRATTLGGASGSPCFSLARQLVGLHHGGVTKKYNQGIPATALMAWFVKEGLDRFLGGSIVDESPGAGEQQGHRVDAPLASPVGAPSTSTEHEATASASPPQRAEPPAAAVAAIPAAPTFHISISNSTVGSFGAGNGINVTGTVTMPTSAAASPRAPAPAQHGSGRAQAAPTPSRPTAATPATLAAGGLASVYLSYGDEDLPFAQQLFEALEGADVPVFFRHEHAVPGARLHRSARKSIHEYEHVILLCSERSLLASSVISELDEMLSREFEDGASERIIPVLLDDFASSGWTPRHPDIRQTILDRVPLDMKGVDRDSGKFQKALKRLLGALRG